MRWVYRGKRRGPAVADDMPPHIRAVAMLLEHANERIAAELPVPCPCSECRGHRHTLTGVSMEQLQREGLGRWTAVNPVDVEKAVRRGRRRRG